MYFLRANWLAFPNRLGESKSTYVRKMFYLILSVTSLNLCYVCTCTLGIRNASSLKNWWFFGEKKTKTILYVAFTYWEYAFADF